MITYRKARELLSVGDVVYDLAEAGVEKAVVQAVLPHGLQTDRGYLDYDMHGELWVLTEIGARTISRKEALR